MTQSFPKGSLLLSPHLDDLAFSLGAALLDGRFPNATLANVFCISASAVNDNQVKTVTSVRKSEDEEFFHSLDTPVNVVYLDRLDAPLRLGIPDEEVCNSISLCEKELSYLHDFIKSRSHSLLIAPLAIGGHVDHRLVYHTACILARDGWSVAFYEDLPYAGGIEMEDIENLVKETSVILGRDLHSQQLHSGWRGNKKLDAVLTYRSQLGPTTLERIICHSQRLNDTAITERLWCAD
jgi:LmbE family N-acetylglucosaminyl deacetylase